MPKHARKDAASKSGVAPGVWKKQRSPPGSTATTVALVWALSVCNMVEVSSPASRSRSRTAAPSTSFPTIPAAATFIPNFAIATPVLQTFPPVVRVRESITCSPPGGGGRRKSIGDAIKSATISPKRAASIQLFYRGGEEAQGKVNSSGTATQIGEE